MRRCGHGGKFSCGAAARGAPGPRRQEIPVDRDYPQMIVPAGHIEPAPRRVRALLGSHVVLDTTRAVYMWESPYYPQYYIPVADVNRDLLVDEQHTQRLRHGTARRHGLRSGEISRPGVARVYTEESMDGLAGVARFDWDALDAWFEEAVQVFVHPRSPYVRVDALRSTRSVRLELDGVALAGDGDRDRPADAVLPQPHRRELRASGAHRHGHRLPLQGENERLLVGPRRRRNPPGPGLGLRLSHPPAAADRRPDRLLQREGGRDHRHRPASPSQHALLHLTAAPRGDGVLAGRRIRGLGESASGAREAPLRRAPACRSLRISRRYARKSTPMACLVERAYRRAVIARFRSNRSMLGLTTMSP